MVCEEKDYIQERERENRGKGEGRMNKEMKGMNSQGQSKIQKKI